MYPVDFIYLVWYIAYIGNLNIEYAISALLNAV